MAGLYIHIPFCAQKCSYCNFYSVANPALRPDFLIALQKEIIQRCHELNDEPIETVYFGGGTPSLLSADEIEDILITINKHFSLTADAEITLEANPDDLSLIHLKALKQIGINRLSIGIQSFHNDILVQINRRHNGQQAITAIENAYHVGFDNISIDLIYGILNQNDQLWIQNLEIAKKYKIPHLSCYALTVEERTVLHKQIVSGKSPFPLEEDNIRQSDLLMNFAQENQYLQYEISNFCLNNQISKHNSAYWNSVPYIGFGPGAHSFRENIRRWNIENVKTYNDNLSKGTPYFEEEILIQTDQYNEYVMTSIRTHTGCDLMKIKNDFGDKYYQWIKKQIEKFGSDLLLKTETNIQLTFKGKHLTDYITRELFFEN